MTSITTSEGAEDSTEDRAAAAAPLASDQENTLESLLEQLEARVKLKAPEEQELAAKLIADAKTLIGKSR
jgi:hypothetical protein